MLELKNILKKYGNRTILDHVSMTFPNCGMIGIQGKSGCGKSTLLYLMGLLDEDYEGEILYNHQRIENKRLFIREHISFVMQNHDYISSLNVKENINIASIIGQYYYTNSTIKKIARQLGIEHKLNAFPNELSGGELKRVSIAKAMLKQSDIVLCDEPTGPLHYEQSCEVMRLLKQLSLNALVIVVSHDIDLINEYCDCVLTLENGKLYGSIKDNKQECIRQNTKRKQSLFFYPLRQSWQQRYKLLFLFLFQWIIIASVFLIYSCSCGVFNALQESKIHFVDAHMISVENRNMQPFEQMLDGQDIVDCHYAYHLEQLDISSIDEGVQMQFLPQKKDHIQLKSGRFPINDDEILISGSLQKRIPHVLHVQYENFQKELKVVGVIENDLLNFSRDCLYFHPNFMNSIDFLKNQQIVVVETADSQTLNVYKRLFEDYHVYCDAIERIEQSQSLLNLAQIVGVIFIVVSFIVSFLFVMIVESIIYLERQHDTAYLLSLGISSKRLMSLTILEALYYGSIISFGGGFIYLILHYYINNVLGIKKFIYFSLEINKLLIGRYDVFLVGMLIYWCMSILGIVITTNKMTKSNVISVLREE